jgi:tyrosyl-tRNA synthetase
MHLRKLQMELAKDITIRVHSQAEFDLAVKASEILFGNSVTQDLETLDEETLLSVLEGVPLCVISKATFETLASVTDLLSEATAGQIFPSKSEARKMIQGGGVSINKQKVANPTDKPAYNLLHGKFLLAQKGKKNYYLIEVKD